ncbi:hypothetical protein PACID_29270 [Acidipropionibacterium acidipropionici ATCC 4875]|uniref:Scramblase n=1 Tax=Acidipropionibacterium acidipropionici (strain ATCC 4875 / DSM 20272 / JCM 6432 / NBRC 12425 / NCIMB 8070 / 4) TaxID=1171373 RepID=K7S7W1_ACIA4|nr:hypothetical protein [Acidipropionibacterium acidipropionici]AFV90692.1 hypothetical protein PACID_29270 [Acidipropionibacterium acidipropionici ATCC 4875]
MSLVDQNVLVLQQVRSFLTNDFDILDADGSPVATIHTEGSALSRMFRGNRELTVLEDGRPVLRITDEVNILSRDSYTVADGSGATLATLTKLFTFATRKIQADLADGTSLLCTGSLFGRSFTISRGDAVAARIERRMPGVADALMGRDRYALSMDPSLPPSYRGAIIGTVIAIDLIRAKEDAASSGS